MQDLDLFSAMASENNKNISENTIEMDEDYRPLAERMRPRNFDEYIGQEKILGKKSFLRRMVQEDKIPSMILYGPPGTGKTTLAKMIAGMTKSEFSRLNAVSAGISDVRKIIEKADENRRYYRKRTIIFLDEIHRFNKAQQDVLLPYVEDGRIILIGATTENPYFEVNGALISRSVIFELKPLEKISRKVERMAGMTIGMVTRRMIVARLALRIVALSSSVASMFLRMPPMSRYANGE